MKRYWYNYSYSNGEKTGGGNFVYEKAKLTSADIQRVAMDIEKMNGITGVMVNVTRV